MPETKEDTLPWTDGALPRPIRGTWAHAAPSPWLDPYARPKPAHLIPAYDTGQEAVSSRDAQDRST